VLQETVTGFEVRCCASQWLYQERRGVHSCVQAAAAARVAGGRNIFAARVAGGRTKILKSATNSACAAVLCHLIADPDAVNKRDG
jgi:hypothetical protein